MRIKQALVSPTLSIFKEALLKRYDLADYHDRNEPSVFFGFYAYRQNYINVANHRSMAVIAYAGSDALWLFTHRKTHKGKLALDLFKKRKNIFHVASSACNMEELKALGLNRRFVLVCPVMPDMFKPCPLGDSVYVYCGTHERAVEYGEGLAKRTEERLKSAGHNVNFIFTYSNPPNNYTRAETIELYKKSLMGMRIIGHDGLSNTAIELGLMGRRIIYNQDIPNAIHYTDEKSIFDAIVEEKKLIGTTNNAVSEATLKAIDRTDWLDTEFYAN